MYEGTNTNRTGSLGGLYLRLRTSQEAAFGGRIERPLNSALSMWL
jgi:hypothetical protein